MFWLIFFYLEMLDLKDYNYIIQFMIENVFKVVLKEVVNKICQ